MGLKERVPDRHVGVKQHQQFEEERCRRERNRELRGVPEWATVLPTRDRTNRDCEQRCPHRGPHDGARVSGVRPEAVRNERCQCRTQQQRGTERDGRSYSQSRHRCAEYR